MELGDAYTRLNRSQPDFGRFYGPANDFPIGAGLVLKGVAFPFYDKAASEFSVGIGRVYIVSHECDIDPANDRPFNDSALLCPIIPLENLLGRYLAGRSQEQTAAFIDALSKRTVDRATYIPAIANELPFGGVLYLNSMTHTNVREFSLLGVEKCRIVSAFGLRYVDAALSHAFLKRPKATPLPLTDALGKFPDHEGPSARRAIKAAWKAAMKGHW